MTEDKKEIYWIREGRWGGHFAIDCQCGGSEEVYSGSHYKSASIDAKEGTRKYEPADPDAKQEHTFYMNGLLLRKMVELHQRDNNGKGLVILCDDCNREFEITLKKLEEIK